MTLPNILESLECVVRALNDSGVRYLIAGGLAVNAHGYTRATHDIDLVIQLSEENTATAMRMLAALGYRPLAPVPIEQFADPATRQQWIREKGLTVFGLVSEKHPQAPIDVFVSEPFDFSKEYEASLCDELQDGLSVRFISLATLLEMKRKVGRAKDLDDIENLRLVK